MTVRLSPHKVSGIMNDYFRGVHQNVIARTRGVDQSTVSIYSSRFRRLTNEKGILQAGKEYGVFDQVDSLRSLSVELSKSKLTVEDALEGLRIIRVFSEMGVSTGRHVELVRLCEKINDPAFIETSLEIIDVERKAGISYGEIVEQSRFFSNELTAKRKELYTVREELDSTSNLLVKSKGEVSRVEARLAKIRRDCESVKRESEIRLAEMRTEYNLMEKELTEYAKLRTLLEESNTDISVLIKLAKEFTNEKAKS